MTKTALTIACFLLTHGLAIAADEGLAARGKAEETRSCIQCHSMRLTHSQRLSKAAWTKEVDKMIAWGSPVKDRESIIAYLADEYSDLKPLPQPEHSGNGAEKNQPVLDPAKARALKAKYVQLTDSWIKGIEFTPAEEQAMRSGKQWEPLMTKGPDDPLAKKVLAAGEPSYEALAALYPGKILDRTILGSYSDPSEPDTGYNTGYNDEFAIYWNGAIGANLIKGRLNETAPPTQPVAHNTTITFRVGPNAELLGSVRKNFSSIGYERGYLPIVIATYTRDGIEYRETALAYKPAGQTEGWDVAYVQFELTNTSASPRRAQLFEDVLLNDGSKPKFVHGHFIDEAGAVLLSDSDGNASFDPSLDRVAHNFNLAGKETKRVCFKIPYIPDEKGLVGAASEQEFEKAHSTVRDFWAGLLAKGASIDVPEPRLNEVWRALLLQNFVLADGLRFTYGSGLRYNDSTYPYENGFATHVFAMYGFKDYADAMQAGFLPMSVTHEGAGRKYQNRRAMVLHHLLENFRLTGKADLFANFKADYYRVANEIISDRHSTMTDVKGARPLSWGLLPPDKPGADVQASTQEVYVTAHNITNCQGLADFGRFLVVTGLDRQNGEEYLREAADFRQTLMSAMRRAAIRIPGRPPFLDLQTLLFRQTPDYGPEPYDDLALGRLQGTYSHYWTDMEFHYNFFNPDDEIAQWLADYTQQRNGFVLGLTRARSQTNRPYGWVNNVYDGGYYNYRLRRGQIDEFLLGLYARFAFGMSRSVYVASEGSPFIGYNTENGGYVGADYSFPNSAANADTLLMLRNSLILEELKDDVETGKLFLLRGAPRAWFASGKQISVNRMATYFGDISYSVKTSTSGKTIDLSIQPPKGHWQTIDISFRQAGSAPIRSVKVNGRNTSDFDASGMVRLQHSAGPIAVQVNYQ